MTLADVLATAVVPACADVARARPDGRALWGYFTPATTDPVIEWLDRHGPFQRVANQVLKRGGATEVVLSSSAAVYLIARAIEYGPAAVAASFDRVMAGNPVTHALVTVVKGVSALEVVAVCPGVTVEPIAGLFNVPEKASALAVGERLHRDGGVPTAIVLRTREAPSYSPRPDGLAPQLLPPIQFPEMQPALNAISLVAGAAVVTDLSYAVVEEIGWPTMIVGGMGRSYIPERVVSLTPDQSPALVESSELLARRPDDEALSRAVRKLREAQGRNNDAERALDLGACLEILLMHEGKSGKSDNTEIGYKLRVRAAWLLGKSLEDRQRIHDLVKSAYDLRSMVAHGGALPAPKSPDDFLRRIEDLRAIEKVCRDLILGVLKSGWPDWKATVLKG